MSATAIFIIGLGASTHIALAPTAYASNLTETLASSTPAIVTVNPSPMLSNCYLYVRSKIASLPLANDIKANTTPHVGAVALFQYGELPHYAIITRLELDGFWVIDSNFGGPGIRTHYIHWDDVHIKGFWQPSDTS